MLQCLFNRLEYVSNTHTQTRRANNIDSSLFSTNFIRFSDFYFNFLNETQQSKYENKSNRSETIILFATNRWLTAIVPRMEWCLAPVIAFHETKFLWNCNNCLADCELQKIKFVDCSSLHLNSGYDERVERGSHAIKQTARIVCKIPIPLLSILECRSQKLMKWFFRMHFHCENRLYAQVNHFFSA